jgi:hypothetical protein
MTMKEKIHAIRFGLTDVKTLSDDEIVEMLDYCLSPDVIGILSNEIHRRRTERLKELNAD